MRPGIFARTFVRPTLEATLDAVAAGGVEAMQFNMALTDGGPSLPDDIAPGTAARVREAAAERGLEIAAVSGTYNMAHPDPAVRERGRRRLNVLIVAAGALGAPVITLCTGTRDPDDMWRRHPDNAGAEAWKDMLASVTGAVEAAEAHGVTLAIEPEHSNAVDSAAAGRRLLDEVASPSLKVVLDAANLLSAEDLGDQRPILEEAFELLGGELVLAHAKDLRRDGAFVAAGQGALDYPLYVALLRQAGYDGALVLHGLGEAEVPASVAFLRSALAQPLRRPG
jgi:sugar phosphate isomerase/epimerase